MKLVVANRLRILDWDIENRPLSYLGSDFTTADITAISASWFGEKKVHVWLLGEHTSAEMLGGFVELYDRADMVTGHYIRNHDLPIVNGALFEARMPLLGEKLTSDTKNDLVRWKELSKSQESLSDMLELQEAKYHMSQKKWREGNRLTAAGLRQTRKRVVDDVLQHKQLRDGLIEAGALKPPRMWYP